MNLDQRRIVRTISYVLAGLLVVIMVFAEAVLPLVLAIILVGVGAFVWAGRDKE